MKHSLRYNDHDIDLPPGEFVIGRAANCQLSLDDPLVSRNHATLTVTPKRWCSPISEVETACV